MFRRILATTDFSEASFVAIREAASLARDGELAVCHVLPLGMALPHLLGPGSARTDAPLAELETMVKEELARRIEALLGPQSRPVSIIVARGEPEAEIVRQAQAWNADLIVLKGHGTTGLSRVFLGRTAERVVRFATVPVLVVRNVQGNGIVLTASDLSDPSLPAVAAGAAEARRRGARLVLLHAIDVWPDVYAAAAGGLLGAIGTLPPPALVQEKRRALLETLEQAILREGISGEARVVEGDPAKTIALTAEEIGADLVVVGTHGRTGLSRLALGSVAERVVHTAICSVLAVRLGTR